MIRFSRPGAPSRQSRRQAGWWRTVRDQVTRRLAVSLLAAGLVLLIVAGALQYFRDRSLRVDAQVMQQYSPVPPGAPGPPTRIKVADLINIPVEGHNYSNGQWTVSETVASYLTQSAKPGEPGNIIVYGHNRPQIFSPLTKTKVGDEVILTTDDGRERRYAVRTIREVDPSQVESLQPTPTETLTIYTCSGFLDSKRFIVIATPDD